MGDIVFGEKIVILREDQPVVIAGVADDRRVGRPSSEFGGVVETFDVVAEFLQLTSSPP
jgi:hypothetical protein